MMLKKSIRLLAGAVLLCGAAAAQASTLFSENFNSYAGGHYTGGQTGTGLAVYYGGSVSGWVASGGNAAHAVNLGSSNYSIMMYSDNALTQSSSIAGSNVAGKTYEVDFLASVANYQDPNGGNHVGDGLLVQVLRGNSTVLASYSYLPGVWAGSMNFNSTGFLYTGDGSGDIHLRIASVINNDVYFGGAIDNLTVSTAPEPTSVALLGLGAAALWRRRRTIKA